MIRCLKTVALSFSLACLAMVDIIISNGIVLVPAERAMDLVSFQDSISVAKTIQLIKIWSHINFESQQKLNWSMSLKLPFGVFGFHHLLTLKQTKSKANFYKCGDKLPYPHYLSWNQIAFPNPDFHQPESFGFLIIL